MEVSKEQAAALQEKLQNMSPEELRNFQKQQCIFCHIIAGKVASRKVYEDERCLAVLDINPANPGHILLLPKEHYSIMPQIPEEEIGHLFTVAKHLSHALLKAFKVEGTNIFVANGIAAGQRAQHFMIHIIPRKENDGLELTIPQHEITEEQMNKIRSILAERIKEKMDFVPSEEPESPQIEEPKDSTDKEIKIEIKSPKKEVVNAEFKEEVKTYVKSESSRKYHVENCPFAKRIKKPVFITKEQAKEFEPCDCTEKKIETSKKEQNPINKKEKKEDKVDLDDIAALLG